MTRRRGAVSVAELVLVFWLYGFVLAGLAAFARAQGRLARAQESALRRAELVRTTRVVLAAELRYLARADLRTAGGDSVRVRAVRGVGRVCEADGDRLRVDYRGDRLPQPAKDSVLLVLGAAELAAAVTEVEGGGACGGVGVRLLLPPGGDTLPLVGALALVFETGTYALGDGALRYRLGAGGRQPLTEAVLDDASLDLHAAALRLRLRPEPAALPGGSEVITVPLLNGSP